MMLDGLSKVEREKGNCSKRSGRESIIFVYV